METIKVSAAILAVVTGLLVAIFGMALSESHPEWMACTISSVGAVMNILAAVWLAEKADR